MLTDCFNNDEDEPISGAELLSEPYDPPFSLVDGLVKEGLLLVGGKPVVGKSWLMLDLALSVATGRPVWDHFAVPEPQSVLYVSLIDRRGRVKHRIDAMCPDFNTRDRLYFLWDLPKLDQGGLEKLRGYIESGRYRLIVIDPLIRLAANPRGCLQLYSMLADLRDLRRRQPVCLAVVMIIKMPDIDRIFDRLPTADYPHSARWFLEYGIPIRTLHMFDDMGRSGSMRLHFVGERWRYQNADNKSRLPQSRQDVIEVLKKYGRPLSPRDVNDNLVRAPDRYPATKQLMYRMMRDGLLVRCGRGRYDVAR